MPDSPPDHAKGASSDRRPLARGPPSHEADFLVVGIGASAGGLDACRKLLAALPANNGMAFILVQHLDPTHESMMVDLLASHTPMTVLQATDGMPAEREHLYIIPPGTYLSIVDGALHLSQPQAHHGARLPFDFLLRSMATACGTRAVCVILSGTGADGSLGLGSVKEKGGLVIAQDPDEAGYGGMPRAAIMTGSVDFVLPVANILRVSSRILLWELFKVFRHEPVISIHKRSRMKLTPGPRRGMHGLIYAFRDRIENSVLASIHKYVKPGDIVFDIGSNIGLWSLLLAELAGPHGRVESFEPVPNTIKRLETNIELSGHRNIHVNRLALGSNPGDVTMFLPRDPGRSALAPESDQDAKVTVKLSRLDDFWTEAGCPRVKFVKMDVEGAEPQVLRGAHQFITTCRPIFITEVNDSKLRLLNEKKDAIHEILYSYNYNSFIFNDHIRDFEPGRFVENADYFEVLFAPA